MDIALACFCNAYEWNHGPITDVLTARDIGVRKFTLKRGHPLSTKFVMIVRAGDGELFQHANADLKVVDADGKAIVENVQIGLDVKGSDYPGLGVQRAFAGDFVFAAITNAGLFRLEIWIGGQLATSFPFDVTMVD
jgi:hypothetical protein